MAPEQARGQPVDKRIDIWAFGVVLYEMLTGRRPFEGQTLSDTVAAVLRQEIDWTRLPADTPDDLRRLLRRCLERDPKDRLHDIADARLVIVDLAARECRAVEGALDLVWGDVMAPRGCARDGRCDRRHRDRQDDGWFSAADGIAGAAHPVLDRTCA